MFEPLHKLLPRSLRRAAAARGEQEARAVAQAERTLAEIFGPGTASRMRPVSCKDGVVTVSCDRWSTAREIADREREIVEILNARLGRRTVRSMHARA
jgi:predicted nucleic acid-binding Zn ribbon protein